jgi:hypothetical protein
MSSPAASKFVFSKHEGQAITPDIIKDAAALFSAHYGIWGPLAEPAKQGHHVRMSSAVLEAACLAPPPARSFCVEARLRVKDGDKLVGHVLAVRWLCEGKGATCQVCWITQLCVCQEYRSQGVATEVSRRPVV